MNNRPLDGAATRWVTWVMTRAAMFYAFAFTAYLTEGAGHRRLR
jgi:hypothetical protein